MLDNALLVTRTTDRKLDEPSWRVCARRDADTLDESVMLVVAGRCDAGVDAVLSLDEARALGEALLRAALPEEGTPNAASIFEPIKVGRPRARCGHP